MSVCGPREEDRGMRGTDAIEGHASELFEAARRFRSAVAAGFARCARMCREGCSAVTPVIGRAVAWR